MCVQGPPKGLYGGGARVWMEGKDLEGFNAHFTYGFIKEPGPFHPLEVINLSGEHDSPWVEVEA